VSKQEVMTRDNVPATVDAVVYFRVVDPIAAVVKVENFWKATSLIAQTTLRKVVGQHTLDEALSETDVINANIQKILDVATLEWGVEVHLVELKDIQLPDSMKRAMARQAEAERDKACQIYCRRGRIDDRGRPWGCVGHDDGRRSPLATAELADAGRARSGEEHYGGVPCTDDERDRRNQQLPHPGNRRRARDHTPAGPRQTIGIVGDRGGNQRRARERCRRCTRARGRLTARLPNC